MIDERRIREILAQYEKHGWNLRRVLLSAPTKENLPAPLFGETEIISSETDAAWFSRPSTEGRETWELRCLSDAPFALIEVFDEDEEEVVREETRREMETRLAEQASKAGSKKLRNES
ncbi:MAG: hypothetical protein ACR2HG_01865 [Pyrinomonadaceae bacterium]